MAHGRDITNCYLLSNIIRLSALPNNFKMLLTLGYFQWVGLGWGWVACKKHIKTTMRNCKLSGCHAIKLAQTTSSTLMLRHEVIPMTFNTFLMPWQKVVPVTSNTLLMLPA